MANNVKISGGASLDSIIEDAFKDSEIVVEKVASECSYKAAKVARDLVRTGISHGRKYNSGWKIKRNKDEAIVYNASQPGLTHLLENGHDIVRNGQKVGHAEGIPHIKPAEEIASKRFVEMVKEQLTRYYS